MQLYSKVNNKVVTFTSLDELIPSTITGLFGYKGEVNLNNIFLTLVTQFRDEESDFIIMFVRYSRETRGFRMKEKLEDKDYFKKSVTISILYKNNKISIKLAENIYHICGLKSLDLGYEIIERLKEKIYESQKLIDFIRKNNKKLNILLNIIEKNCIYKNDKVIFPFRIVKLNEEEMKFINILYSYANYAPNLNWYVSHIRKVLNITDNTIIEAPEVISCIPIMRNYIYSIGKPINRIVTALVIRHESTRFIVKYNNTTQHYVRLKVPFTEEELKVDTYKKNKKKRYHHFFIHKTGTISQTGRDFEIIKDLFKELINIIEQYYDAITDMNMNFLIDKDVNV
jgi:hypothetical protein